MMKWLLLLLVPFLLNGLGQASSRPALLAEDGLVVSLTDSDAQESIFHQMHLTLALYYVQWCSHCERVAQTVAELAKYIANWRAVIKVVAINCTTYSETCRELLPRSSFPTILLYPPRSTSKFDSLSVEEHRSVGDLYNVLLSFVNKIDLGVLTPSFVNSKEEICNAFSKKDNGRIFAIIERKSSVHSAQVILNLINYRDSVQIKRFYGNIKLEESLSLIYVFLPAILEIRGSDCNFKAVMTSGQNMDAITYEFEKMVKDTYPMDAESSGKEFLSISSNSANRKVIKYKLNYIDLYNTLRYTILTEMLQPRKYNEAHIEVIKQYFSTILKYFPFKNENVRRLFKRMNMYLAHKNGTSGMRVDFFREHVKISDGFLWPKESYRFCNGSRPQYRGYSCGQWVLFHVLTVNEYLNPPSDGVKHEVLSTMLNYTRLFFSFSGYVDHFVNETRNMASELTHPNSSVLYLWHLHNKVNERIARDDTEDPYYPKAPFPTITMCESCWVDGHFNQTDVLSFLTKFYAKKAISGSMSVGISLVYLFFLSIVYFTI